MPCLPWVQQAVCTGKYSKTISITNRISKTAGQLNETQWMKKDLSQGISLWNFRNLGVRIYFLFCYFIPTYIFVFSLLLLVHAGEGKWLPTPAFLPREFHGQRNLVVYSPWGHKESDPTEQLVLSLLMMVELLKSDQVPQSLEKQLYYFVHYFLSIFNVSSLVL